MLGDKRFEQWRKKFGYDYEKYLQRLEVILGRSEHIRSRLLALLDRFATMPTQFLADAIARQGWVYLAEEAREITDHEWWRHVGEEAVQGQVSAMTQESAAATMGRHVRKHKGI